MSRIDGSLAPTRARTGRTAPSFRVGSLQPYLFMLPVVFSLAFFAYNLGLTAYESLHYHIVAYPQMQRFVGLDNYLKILVDPMTRTSFGLSLIWVAGTTIPTFLLGFGLALLLNQQFRGRGFYRALVLSPWAISGVVSAMAWSWIFNGPFGVLNDVLVQLGLVTERQPWLASPDTAMAGVIIASVWRGMPFFAITILAGLQAISPVLYEAASIDGASPWQKFWQITIPMLKGVIVTTTLLRAIWTFNFVENIFLMTYGGPANATTTWAFYLFQKFFDAGDVGYSAAMGFALFLFLVAFSAGYLRLSRSVEVEGV